MHLILFIRAVEAFGPDYEYAIKRAAPIFEQYKDTFAYLVNRFGTEFIQEIKIALELRKREIYDELLTTRPYLGTIRDPNIPVFVNKLASLLVTTGGLRTRKRKNGYLSRATMKKKI